jgi:hypothetical protein
MNSKGLLTGYSRILRFMEDYAYYRELGWSPRKAWRLASQTIVF